MLFDVRVKRKKIRVVAEITAFSHIVAARMVSRLYQRFEFFKLERLCIVE